uniref:Uncharacterized protein n=1 Tax=Cucumis melo TaxID=3656 RepID=A0A9I9EAR7_CUCME
MMCFDLSYNFKRSVIFFIIFNLQNFRASELQEVNPVNNMKYQVIDGTSQYMVYLPTKWSNKSLRRSLTMANT